MATFGHEHFERVAAALCAPPFGLSEPQAEGVLGLTLRRLTGLEVGKLKEEEAVLRTTISGLEVRLGAGRACVRACVGCGCVGVCWDSRREGGAC